MAKTDKRLDLTTPQGAGVGCSWCGVFRVWGVQGVGVRGVGCLGCGVFREWGV